MSQYISVSVFVFLSVSIFLLIFLSECFSDCFYIFLSGFFFCLFLSRSISSSSVFLSFCQYNSTSNCLCLSVLLISLFLCSSSSLFPSIAVSVSLSTLSRYLSFYTFTLYRSLSLSICLPLSLSLCRSVVYSLFLIAVFITHCLIVFASLYPYFRFSNFFSFSLSLSLSASLYIFISPSVFLDVSLSL